MTNDVSKLINMLSSDASIAFDTETNGLNRNTCYVCGYGVSDGNDVAYVPVRHAGGGVSNGNIEDPESFEKIIAAIIRDRAKPLILQNSKFDMHLSENHGIQIRNVEDTMSTGAILNENRFSFSLDNLCKEFDIPQKKGKELYAYISDQFGCKPDRSSMAYFHLLRGDDRMAYGYACGDNISTWHLNNKQRAQLDIQELQSVADLENKLTPVLYKMERRGIKIDLEEMERVKTKVNELHLEAYSQVPIDDDLTPVNVKSQKDLQKYFEWCGITDWPLNAPTDRFPDGSPSFNKNFLGTSQQGLIILEARKYDHLKSSFIDPLPNHIFNGRIYTNFNQTAGEFGGTKTGRLSSSNPNMQQIPKRDEFTGRIFRKMFVPDDDFVFVEFDYSQAEPRLFTHYSKEPSLVKGYSTEPNIDMHSIAAEYMGISRKVAKNLNLGILYGMWAKALAGHLNISLDEAYKIHKLWHSTFPEVSKFTDKAAKRAEQRGYVKTILGRRARFPDPRWSYRAANRIVQGGSADILKYKMIELDDWLTSEGLHDVCQMLLNIHDAILFQIHKNHLHLIKDIERIMCDLVGPPFNLAVPFRVDYHQGSNWSEASYGQ